MRVPFDLRPKVVQLLRANNLESDRSEFVSGLIIEKLRASNSSLRAAAKKANGLTRVNEDMKNWEAVHSDSDKF